MTTLLIPAAGLSTRFGLSRPKFLLQHPVSGTMLQASMAGFGSLKDSGVTDIRVVTLSSYFEDLSSERLAEDLQDAYGLPVDFKFLDSPTGSMVETICKGIADFDEDSAFLVKDCDNQMSLDVNAFLKNQNAIAFADLRKHPEVVAHNKSFIDVGQDSIVKSLVEKVIQGPFINVGCVKFGSVSDFIAASRELSASREVYVSDIVSAMLDWGLNFKAQEVESYHDWGTLKEWLSYTSTFKTLFVDLDGVVVENANPLAIENNWWDFRPISENVSALKKRNESGRVKIVFTTARTEKYRESVQRRLVEFGFSDFDLIMGLPHAGRVLINDFATTNPYPSARAISIPRDARNLDMYLD